MFSPSAAHPSLLWQNLLIWNGWATVQRERKDSRGQRQTGETQGSLGPGSGRMKAPQREKESWFSSCLFLLTLPGRCLSRLRRRDGSQGFSISVCFCFWYLLCFFFLSHQDLAALQTPVSVQLMGLRATALGREEVGDKLLQMTHEQADPHNKWSEPNRFSSSLHSVPWGFVAERRIYLEFLLGSNSSSGSYPC